MAFRGQNGTAVILFPNVDLVKVIVIQIPNVTRGWSAEKITAKNALAEWIVAILKMVTIAALIQTKIEQSRNNFVI